MKTFNEHTETPLVWKTRKVVVQAGDYKEANQEVTQHYTVDGRFTITPTGQMSYKKEFGIRGGMDRRWRWSGFRLDDLSPDRPSYVSASKRVMDVGTGKRMAARRAARNAE